MTQHLCSNPTTPRGRVNLARWHPTSVHLGDRRGRSSTGLATASTAIIGSSRHRFDKHFVRHGRPAASGRLRLAALLSAESAVVTSRRVGEDQAFSAYYRPVAGTIAAFTFLGLVVALMVVLTFALTRKRHREGRTMWEKTDLPWYFSKRNRPGRRSGDVSPD